jgi:hypothetical protein
MSIRDNFQNHPVVTVLVCAIVAIMAVLVVVNKSGSSGTTPPRVAWFYDLSTGRLFTADRGEVPPLTVDGSTAVRARVYGCNGCGEGDRHVVVIEKYPDAVAEELRVPPPADDSSPEANAYTSRRERLRVEAMLIAAPPRTPGEQVAWTPLNSPQAQSILARLDDLCPGAVPEMCEPH